MPILGARLQNGAVQFAGTQQQAREQLKQIATSVTNGDTVKSGYLKVIGRTGAGGGQDLEVGLKSSFWSSADTRLSADLVKQLIKSGYGHQPEVLEALDRYLGQTGGKIGSQSFIRLVKMLTSAETAAKVADVAADPSADRLGHVRVKATARLNVDGLSDTVARRLVPASAPPPPQVSQAELPQAIPMEDEAVKPEAPQAPVPQAEAQPMEQVSNTELHQVQATPLTKASDLSVKFDGPTLAAKSFNLLDTGPHQALGTAINDEVAARGLKPSPGMTRIRVNDQLTYCFFDSAGMARALLPKGNDASDHEIQVISLNASASEGLKQKILLDDRDFQGKLTQVEQPSYLREVLLNLVLRHVGKDVAKAKAFLAPLDSGQRIAVQFRVGGDPWLAELEWRPGKSSQDIAHIKSAFSFSNSSVPLSVSVAPLDEFLPEGPINSGDLKQAAPQGLFDKRTRINFDHVYGQVRTTQDGAYVKKFYQAEASKTQFFENLVSNDVLGPHGSAGIVNRMLVGVPVAGSDKSIGPPGPKTRLAQADLSHRGASELREAARTAVDDLFIVTRAGFRGPEQKQDHYLIDVNAERLEIKMIDFWTGRRASVNERKQEFQAAVTGLLLQLKGLSERPAPDAAIQNFDEILAEIQTYADSKLEQIG